MSTTQHTFIAEQYGSRAADYVTSTVHRDGADLDAIEELLKGLEAARALDLGCGGGHVSYRASPYVAEVVACDVTSEMLDAVAATAAARGLANITVNQAAAESLPFPDASFDIVLCRFSTHHWPNMEAGLREARRVLKPSAPALFIDVVAPANPALDSHLQAVELLRDASHVRNYSIAEWTAALARSGLPVSGITVRTLRMEFPVWTARTRTPPVHVQAIRSLQSMSPVVVREHFAIGPDGSFNLETAGFLVHAMSLPFV
ncbi:MAG: class I SAM-dependent methyltransferase [Acetobacteraceae bacterium]